jgi:hypothetical protein
MNKYETDKLRGELKEFILLCREHAARTQGELREANLSHMNSAIRDLIKLNHEL